MTITFFKALCIKHSFSLYFCMKNKLHPTSVLHLLLFEDIVSFAIFIRHEVSIFPKLIKGKALRKHSLHRK